MVDLTRRGFLIGTGAFAATVAIAPKLILPEKTLVANAQGIIVEMGRPVLSHPATTLMHPDPALRWVIPHAKVKFPIGRVMRAWAGHEEIKWDQRKMSFQFNSSDGMLEFWDMEIADPVHDAFVIPNFLALVERKT